MLKRELPGTKLFLIDMIAKMSALTAALSVVERNEDMRCAYDDLLEAQRHIEAVLPTIKGMGSGE